MHKKIVNFEAPAKKEGVDEGVEVGPHLHLHPNHVIASLDRLPFTEMIIGDHHDDDGDVGLCPLHHRGRDEGSKKRGRVNLSEKAKNGNGT